MTALVKLFFVGSAVVSGSLQHAIQTIEEHGGRNTKDPLILKLQQSSAEEETLSSQKTVTVATGKVVFIDGQGSRVDLQQTEFVVEGVLCMYNLQLKNGKPVTVKGQGKLYLGWVHMLQFQGTRFPVYLLFCFLSLCQKSKIKVGPFTWTLAWYHSEPAHSKAM